MSTTIGGNFPEEIKDWMNEQFKSANAVELNDNFYIHGLQAAKALGYKDSSVIEELDRKDKLEIPMDLWKEWIRKGETDFHTPNGIHVNLLNTTKQIPDDLTFISFPALTDMILNSNKRNTKVFKRWVFKEVIPSVNVFGAYMTPKAIEHVEQTGQLP